LLAGGVGLGLAAAWALRPAPPLAPSTVRFEVHAPSLGVGLISPDGKQLVYVAEDKLWLRELDRVEPRELAGTAGAAAPFWSPDGAWIGYGASGMLWKVAVGGGKPLPICELPDGQWTAAAGGAWLAGGSIVFTTGSTGLLEVNDQGGDPAPYLDIDPEVDRDFHDASPLPDGRGILFVSHGKTAGASLALSVVAGGVRKPVLTFDKQWLRDPVYSPSGHIVFQREQGLWAVPFSLDTLAADGEPFLVATEASTPSVSASGTLTYRAGQAVRSRQLGRHDRAGALLAAIGEPQEARPFPALSPDGTRVAIAVRDHGDWDAWIHDLERGTRTRLTSSGDAFALAWAPDGTKIAYTAGTIGPTAVIYLVNADGSGEPRALAPGTWPSFSSDGRYLLYTAFDDGDANLHYLDLAGTSEPVRFLATPNAEDAPRLAPNGRHVAYASSDSGRREVYIRDFPGGEGRVQVSVDGGDWPRWSASGDRLFYARGNAIFEVAVSAGQSLKLGRPQQLFERSPPGSQGPTGSSPGFDVSGDGESFYYIEQVGEQAEGSITVVLNWFEGFRR
jgi:serine/threonine-protein kinase